MRPHLTAEEVEAVVAGITYRPGWVLTTARDTFAGTHGPPEAEVIALRVEAPVIDTRRDTAYERAMARRSWEAAPMADVSKVGHLHQLRPLMLLTTRGHVLINVLELLQRVEAHEACEWFRHDGAMVVDTGRRGMNQLEAHP